MKWHNTDREKIFAKDISDKELLSRKNIENSKIEQDNKNPIKNGPNTLTETSQKKI
jgi:hypothetical protein